MEFKPTTNTIKTPINNFTKDQLNAYTNLVDFIKKPYNKEDYKRALVGPAGTGKTYSLKAVINNCGLSYSLIGLAAPTHKACRILKENVNIKGININTLQSDLGLRLNFDVDKFDINNPPFDPKGRIKIKDYRLYIVDEASMINRGLKIFLEKICCENNIKIIYCGDESQLAPVNERYSSAFKGLETYRLTEIIRQGFDNPISPLLEMLRNDIKYKKFSFLEYISTHRQNINDDNTKGYIVLNPEEFKSVVYREFSDEQFVKNIDLSKVVAYTNACVSGWNSFIRNAIVQDAEKSVITKNDLIISYTTIVDDFNDPVIKNSEEYIINDIVNYVHPKYELNGFLVRFTAIHGGHTTSPLFILNHLDKTSFIRYCQISNNLLQTAKASNSSNRAARWKDYYSFKESCLVLINITADSRGNLLTSRDLDYGFALTSHKSQGSTFNNVCVDVNDIVYDKYGHPYTDCEEINRRLYVACSRAKDKLYLKYGL